MKKLSVFLVLLTLVWGCGKDEKNSNEVVTTNPYTGGYLPPGNGYPGGSLPPGSIPGNGYSSFNDYKLRVQNGQFATPRSGGVEYSYRSYSTTTNSSSSWWIFDFYSYSGSTTTFFRSYEGAGQYYHDACGVSLCPSLNTIISSFVNLMNSATYYYPISSTRFMILTNDSRVFEFDLSAPAVANPISMRRLNGADQYYISGSYYY
jgi:hypothetical protein